MPATKDTCGTKHLKLTLAILGLVVVVCLATLGPCYLMSRNVETEVDAMVRGLQTSIKTRLDGLELRIRLVEQSDAANAARFEAIKESLAELKRR